MGSPSVDRTTPERADTRWMVPVLARRFPAAADRCIRRSSRWFPASGREVQKTWPWGPWSIWARSWDEVGGARPVQTGEPRPVHDVEAFLRDSYHPGQIVAEGLSAPIEGAISSSDSSQCEEDGVSMEVVTPLVHHLQELGEGRGVVDGHCPGVLAGRVILDDGRGHHLASRHDRGIPIGAQPWKCRSPGFLRLSTHDEGRRQRKEGGSETVIRRHTSAWPGRMTPRIWMGSSGSSRTTMRACPEPPVRPWFSRGTTASAGWVSTRGARHLHPAGSGG
jgi:hypothetical protein